MTGGCGAKAAAALLPLPMLRKALPLPALWPPSCVALRPACARILVGEVVSVEEELKPLKNGTIILFNPQVRVRMVDFAHTFASERGARDTNFLAGLRALLARLRALVHAQLAADLA